MISAEKLSVHFRRGRRKPPIRAVDALDLHVPRGAFFALLGENGAGKSTAMHAFLGLLRPTSGSVTVMGETPLRGAHVFSRIAYLPEEPIYPEYLSVEEALAYYAGLFDHRIPRKHQMELLEIVGLAGFRDLRLSKCSKGMKQKLGIAQCLLNGPSLLFLDEPMRGLDPVGVREFRDILVRMNREGTTIVMNSHILAEVESVASHVAILSHGKLVLFDEMRHLLQQQGSVSYRIEIESSLLAGVPSMLRDVERERGLIRGIVDESDLQALIASLGEGEARLLRCEAMRRSLEDTFMAVVSRGSDA